jgi:DNA-directed RNA polymerase specialized sigma24 family protein
MIEKLATLAPGRLSVLVEEGLRGHHLLFDFEAIRAAFEAPDEVVTPDEANLVGEALLVICREPLDTARASIDALPPDARTALIRLYFRLLDRAGGEDARH